jgi:hypothetical protein
MSSTAFTILTINKGGELFMGYPNNNGSFTLNGLTEGDRIQVLGAGGGFDMGVFLRFEDGFLVWVRDNAGTALPAFTSLDGISINKLT